MVTNILPAREGKGRERGEGRERRERRERKQQREGGKGERVQENNDSRIYQCVDVRVMRVHAQV